MKYNKLRNTHIVIDSDRRVIGGASSEKGAKDIARNNFFNVKGTVIKLKKSITDKALERLFIMGYHE
tara:strand:+ start:29 stop:229 length:201 start_codon:yes stop_codon:yes gene_type:complete